MNLYEAFNELDGKRSYYGIRMNINDCFAKSAEENMRNCKKFIEEHFYRGGKAVALEIPWDDEYCQKGKHIHTVSLYLLGFSMINSFSSKVEEKLEKLIPSMRNQNDDTWYDFRYVWFLTCLYHDIGSCIERTRLPPNPSERQKTMAFHLGDLDIRYTPYIHELRTPCVKWTRYSEDVVSNYFYYRACNGEVDHGIIGGYMLFDKLCKNFYNKMIELGEKSCQFNTYDHNGKALLWRRDHLDLFAYVADTLICHNMWTANINDDEEVKTYKAYGLSPLIVGDNKLSFREYPLHFMLCLLDSLEPTKRFLDVSPKDVLSYINICQPVTLDNNVIHTTIEISWEPCVKKWDGFQQWLSTLQNIKNWMDVSVSDTANLNMVEIDF